MTDCARLRPGTPYPLGATLHADGANFAIFSENATGVSLVLFDGPDADRESRSIPVTEQTDGVWHVFVPGIRAGQLYGYRVDGPFDPLNGQRFNPAKVLLDPYAKAIGRSLRWSDDLFGYRVGDPAEDLSRSETDNAATAPLGAVVDPAFDWGDEHRPQLSLRNTLIYETHVRGFSKLNSAVPEELRGTYAGLAHPASVEHLQKLGITAVELMPVHHHVDDRGLVDRGLSNYWGYNTLAFFAPEPSYAGTNDPLREFREMVRALHAAGIELILDVVYNHTAEGSHLGPTLSMRGVDNRAYYHLVADQARYYDDFTGTGNTLNAGHPRVLQLIMDSLRYWVLECHVDGFRFDLAAALSRGVYRRERLTAFFDIIHQDPVLSQVKLIAEPWDTGPDGHQTGNFPPGWAEWNGHFRDSVRRFWRGEQAQIGELATRITGSADLYQHTGRSPVASVNFITAHDGFTLDDLVSYNQKHNEANGLNNTDGIDCNFSANCGAEGTTDDPGVLARRAQRKRNLFATLMLAQGTPMIRGGDELGQTHHGNNNVYCQDNDMSWYAWDLDERRSKFLAFCRTVIGIWRAHPVFRRRTYFRGDLAALGPDLAWLAPDGNAMTPDAWSTGFVQALGILMNGDAMSEVATDGSVIRDDTFYLMLNSSDTEVGFMLPAGEWNVVLDTARDERDGGAASPLHLAPGSVVLAQKGKVPS